MTNSTSLFELIGTNKSLVTESLPKILRASVRSANVAFHQLFNFYLMALVLVIGVIANGIIVIVMRDVSFRKLPLSVYFTALAISDTVVLCFTAGLQFIKQASEMNYFRNTFLCSTCGFFINFATGTSSWFIVYIACERLLVVKFPLKAKSLTSRTKAIITLLSVTIGMFLLNSYMIFMIDYSTRSCQFLPIFKAFSKTVPGMLFAVGMNLLPLCITCMCYITLVLVVVRKRKVAPQSGGMMVKEKVTTTSLYICLAFMVLTSPVAVYIMLLRLNGWTWNPTNTTLIFDTLTQFLRQFNYSVNFFINVATNPQFRHVVSKLFKRGNLTNRGNSSNT